MNMADAVATPTTPVPSHTSAPRPPALRADALGKRVALPSGELVILQDVGFAIAPGDVVAIVGASGSGKSTLLSLLAGLDTPSDGGVEIDGDVISTLDEDGRAKVRGDKVGFVFQNFQLLPSLTALENVMLPLELRGDSDAETPARAILGRVGLGERLGHYPRQLSGGEQQRVAIARAFVNRPSILLADEPTGNLDPRTSVGIMRLLDRINRTGTTIVMATHDDEIVDQMRKRVIELVDGVVVRDQDRGVYGAGR